jgi:phosphonate transport system ATP-binding protein
LTAPLVRFAGETLGYGQAAVLSGVELEIRAGERVALLGRSGAGKSTLLAEIYRRAAAVAALIPQSAALVPQLSVFHNVYMGRLDRHPAWRNLLTLLAPPRARLAEVAATLAEVDLADKLRARAGELSGGQQQRTSVARALYNGRPLVIGDEPVSALDGEQARRVLGRLAARHETLVLAMHDVPLALETCDRVVVLQGGRVALDAPAAGLDAAALRPFYDEA